jgi:hypothetical protein
MTMAAEVIFEEREDRRTAVSLRKRHTEQAGRLVHDEQLVVLVEDLKAAELEGSRAAPGTARPVHPDADDVSGSQPPRGFGRPHFYIVQEDLSPLERRCDALTRSEPFRGGEELVEPDLAIVLFDLPLRWKRWRHGSADSIREPGFT